jgi:hypothetical protein
MSRYEDMLTAKSVERRREIISREIFFVFSEDALVLLIDIDYVHWYVCATQGHKILI